MISSPSFAPFIDLAVSNTTLPRVAKYFPRFDCVKVNFMGVS